MLEEIFNKTSFKDINFIIIASLGIVSFWRGIWGLLDVYLIPKNQILSFFVSAALGLIVLFSIAFYKKNKKKN